MEDRAGELQPLLHESEALPDLEHFAVLRLERCAVRLDAEVRPEGRSVLYVEIGR